MDLVARWRSIGVTRGILGGSKPWMVVAGVLWGARAVKWALERHETIVYRTVLEPGERLEVVHLTTTVGRQRRSR